MIPHNLIESELFGHRKGAFTGARENIPGRFALADKGTLFLDELETVPVLLQPKLLRAIETGEIWPVGEETPSKIDVRIIAASNIDIETMVTAGKFRKDLFYRLNGISICMPPLRHRPEDIPVIARTILRRYSANHPLHRQGPVSPNIELSAEALSYLMRCSWPGNVRELVNVLEKAIVRLSHSGKAQDRIELEHIDQKMTLSRQLPFKEAKDLAVNQWARARILAALDATGGNVSHAAKLLKMNQNALFKLIKKYNLSFRRG